VSLYLSRFPSHSSLLSCVYLYLCMYVCMYLGGREWNWQICSSDSSHPSHRPSLVIQATILHSDDPNRTTIAAAISICLRSSSDQQRSGHPSLIHSGDHLLLSYLSLRGRGRPSWTAPLRGGVPAMKPHDMSADPMPWVAIPVATWSQGRSGQHYLSMMRSPSHLSLLSGVCWGLKICLLEAVPAITVPDALPRSRYSFCGPRSPMQWFQIFGK
jgi:hypothetical protein